MEKPKLIIDNESDTNYYIKKIEDESPFSTAHIRAIFENRQKRIGYCGSMERFLRGTYENDFLQIRWEEFFNGFRACEEAQDY